MAWTTPITWSTGQIVTAAQMNEQIKNNEDYLYGTLPYTISQASTSKVIGTEYQNTTGKIMSVALTIYMSSVTGTCDDSIYCSSITPASTGTRVGRTVLVGIVNAINTGVVTFLAPPNYYYKIVNQDTGTGSSQLTSWTEWILH